MAEYNDPQGESAPLRAFVQHSAIPPDARRMGFDRNTEEGAMIAMAAGLSPAKWTHRVVAWFLLLAFAGPWLLGILYEIF